MTTSCSALPSASGAFYDRYLIAKRHSLAAGQLREARAAAAELEALIAERPDFGLTYPPLVRLYNTDFGCTAFGSSGPPERDRALELAKGRPRRRTGATSTPIPCLATATSTMASMPRRATASSRRWR